MRCHEPILILARSLEEYGAESTIQFSDLVQESLDLTVNSIIFLITTYIIIGAPA